MTFPRVEAAPHRRRNLLVVAAACFVAVVAAMFENDRVSGNQSWQLPDGGRMHLSRSYRGYTLAKVGRGGGVVVIPAENEILDAELRTDDLGSYWLVDRARRSVVASFAASDGAHVGASTSFAPIESFSVDAGRVIEPSHFFGLF